MGNSMHGVQGSPFLVMLQRFSPRGGGDPIPMERIRSRTWWLSCGGRWGGTHRCVLAVSMVTGPCTTLCALVVGLWPLRFGPGLCLSHHFGL